MYDTVIDAAVYVFSSDLFITFLKAAFVMGALLHMAAFTTWFERKGSAVIQNRVGANRASIVFGGFFGVWNTLVADPVKALLKEDFCPKTTSQFMHSLAPFLGVFPVLISFAVVPFGPPIVLEDRVISLQLANLDVGVLYVFAMGSLAVYGCVIAGWVSNNKFSLFGGLRASAQMISYEITMGISLVGLFAVYQTLDINKIIAFQGGNNTFFGLPAWGVFLNPIAFIIFFISVMAETKRAPFDLPESESELVAGYMTEYSGMKFLLFWLGEFAEIAVASSLVVLLFFGGWQLPWVDITTLAPEIHNFIFGLIFSLTDWGFVETVREAMLPFVAPIFGAHVFAAKVIMFCMLQVIIRWTLPRFRYDQLMDLCWKIMLPIAFANVVITILLVLAGFYGGVQERGLTLW